MKSRQKSRSTVAPVDLAVGDAVEVLFQPGGEFVFDVAGEEVLQERHHDAALVLGVEALLLQPHIVAVLQHLQDRRVGRGPADAELFHALDQRGFRVARRRLGEVLRGGDRALGERLAGAHRGQALAFVVLLLVVLALLVERQEAVELDHRAGRAQVEQARADLRGDVDGGALELGRLHLARHRAQPDQFVELGLVGIEKFGDVARAARHVGRAHRFVGFLRGLLLGLVGARRVRHILLAVLLDAIALRIAAIASLAP